jgi:lipopolysaccharide export LptBFGC system permease protein LptF
MSSWLLVAVLLVAVAAVVVVLLLPWLKSRYRELLETAQRAERHAVQIRATVEEMHDRVEEVERRVAGLAGRLDGVRAHLLLDQAAGRVRRAVAEGAVAAETGRTLERHLADLQEEAAGGAEGGQAGG